MLRAAGTALIAASTAFLTFGVVAAATSQDELSSAATARSTAARVGTTETPPAPSPEPPAPQPTPQPPAPEPSPADEGAEVVSLLNAERASRGLAPVTIQSQVVAAAEAHSADQAATGVMSHTGSDGSNTGDRLERAGFTWRGWGENVGAGYRNSEHMFDGWMNSTGHRENMLGDYAYVGVAVVDAADGTRFWTMVLAN